MTEKTIVFYDPRKEPFEIFGLYNPLEPGQFIRIPMGVAEKCNPGVVSNGKFTAGGRVRFKTNSTVLRIKVKTGKASQMYHATPLMESGFDYYFKTKTGYKFGGCFKTDFASRSEYSLSVNLPGGEKEITLNMPLYGAVHSLEIGLEEGATLSKHSPYSLMKPVVYYGSSITQGGCASRPGKSYQALIERKYDINYTNLGFSGSAKGEPAMCEFLADQEMSAFVCDYDHNAPTVEHLAATHYPLYEAIRAKHPKIPYIMVTRPGFFYNPGDVDRRAVIMDSYLKALRSGDRNVWFVDGAGFFRGMELGDWSVDNCHPTDDGFEAMAASIGEVIGKLLEKGFIKE